MHGSYHTLSEIGNYDMVLFNGEGFILLSVGWDSLSSSDLAVTELFFFLFPLLFEFYFCLMTEILFTVC